MVNPANRVLSTYDRLIAVGNENKSNTQVQSMWAKVFELKPPADNPDDDVPKFLTLLRDEIELARLMLGQLDVPKEIYDGGFKAFKNAASPGMVLQARESIWSNVVGKEIRLQLAVGAWALRDSNEEVLSPEDIKAYEDRYRDLEKAAADLPPKMQAIMRRQAEGMLAALRVYRVRGAKPLAEAVRSTIADVALQSAQIDVEWTAATPKAKGAFAKGIDLLKTVAEAADSISKVKKAGEDIVELTALAAPYVAMWGPLLLQAATK